MTDDYTPGWHWLFNGRKAHYFDGPISLCGKWMIFAIPKGDGGYPHCKVCERILEKRLERESERVIHKT